MDINSEELDWQAPNRTTPTWNSSSAPTPINNEVNSSYSDGSYFWLLQNSSVGTTNAPSEERNMALAKAEVAILSLILALNMLSNCFVLWVLLRRRKNNAPMHHFMVNLCVADLVVAFFQVFPQLVWDITGRFQGPDMLCRSVKYMQIVGMFASSYMIVAMTVDRHYAICCPFQAYKLGAVSRFNIPIAVAWGLSLLLSIPQVFIFSKTKLSTGEFDCWANFAENWGLKAYVTWMTLAVFILPVIIITVCQVQIFKEIHDNINVKTKKVVSADLKKNIVIFRMPSLRKNNDKTRQSERGRGSILKESRRGFHRRIKCDTLQSLCNGHNSQQPDCCTCSFQNSQGGNKPQHSTDSPDVLLHTLSHTPCPINQHSSDCFRTIQNYSKPCANSTVTPAEICNEVSPFRVSSSISRKVTPPPPGISKAMTKTLRMTLVIVLVYTVCWSPYFIVQLWAAWDPNAPINGVAFTILMLLASLNSFTNPWIYAAFSSSISQELLSLLHCRPRSTRRSSLHEDSSGVHTSSTNKD